LKKRLLIGLAAILVAYVVLLIPESDPPATIPSSSGSRKMPFVWNQDAFWRQLEEQYVKARAIRPESLLRRVDSLLSLANRRLVRLANAGLKPEDHSFAQLEDLIFQTAPLIAAHPDRFAVFNQLVARIRNTVKQQSEQWDMNDTRSRETLYRLLYGGRAAVEEIMLNLPSNEDIDPLTHGANEPSQTPSASILGVVIHSGDILVSRGGAPTSALIARGNDFPGNFSHVALVYVHPQTHLMSIIESHIERGVSISTMEEYLSDTKLRVMILRLWHDLPLMQQDPVLPHRAAELVLERARQTHIPYDFAMDYENPDKLFCSEVASFGYKKVGVQLWMGISTISSSGLRSWLSAFGVRNFETQVPSDLEYDPQLRVVAEWRDLETLRKDHFDNAVTEVMLEGAEAGDRLTYNWFLLPVARVAKAYSSLLNVFGRIGPIPEGMTATTALRNEYYTAKHGLIEDGLTKLASNFERERGYAPPYWDLVQMARTVKRSMEIPRRSHSNSRQ
jgi:hypothetical protein